MLDFVYGLWYNVIKLVAMAITLHFDLLFFNILKRGALDRVSYPIGCNSWISNPAARLTNAEQVKTLIKFAKQNAWTVHKNPASPFTMGASG